jgi:hypothetical protein
MTGSLTAQKITDASIRCDRETLAEHQRLAEGD